MHRMTHGQRTLLRRVHICRKITVEGKSVGPVEMLWRNKLIAVKPIKTGPKGKYRKYQITPTQAGDKIARVRHGPSFPLAR
jgi:hypothetical protein